MGIAVSEGAAITDVATPTLPTMENPVAAVDDLHVTFRRNGRSAPR